MKRFIALSILLLIQSQLFALLTITGGLQISSPAGNSLPQIAQSPTGNAIAVWVANNNNLIVASFFNSATSTWSAVLSLGTGGSPQVGMDQSGNGVIIWANGYINQIQAAYFTAATSSFSAAVNVTSFSSGVNSSPQIAVSSVSGNAIAVWLNNSISQFVFASEFTFSTKRWSTPIQLSTHISATPQISVDQNGHGIAIWQNSFKGTIEVSHLKRS